MPRSNRLTKDRLYNEAEAAAELGITLARLHEVLDQHIFTNGNARPTSLHFNASDLLLLGYWCSGERTASHEVITMPKRG
jgi:prophage maintenance system killer protein